MRKYTLKDYDIFNDGSVWVAIRVGNPPKNVAYTDATTRKMASVYAREDRDRLNDDINVFDEPMEYRPTSPMGYPMSTSPRDIAQMWLWDNM